MREQSSFFLAIATWDSVAGTFKHLHCEESGGRGESFDVSAAGAWLFFEIDANGPCPSRKRLPDVRLYRSALLNQVQRSFSSEEIDMRFQRPGILFEIDVLLLKTW
jgi:hypothetical protein